MAPTSPDDWAEIDQSQWLAFEGVSRLNVTGSGIGKIDGRGAGWWSQSCRDHPNLVSESDKICSDAYKPVSDASSTIVRRIVHH